MHPSAVSPATVGPLKGDGAVIGQDPELLRLRLEFARLARSSASMQERAAAILQHLGRVLRFDAGWLAVRDPEQNRHVPLATTGADAALHDYFDRPEADAEVDLLGLNRRRPPMLASEIASPLSEVRTWAEHLLPAGFREGLAAGLFTSEGRHVGFLSLLSADPARPNRADRRVVAAVTTLIADHVDRTRDLAATARTVQNASAGVVLTRRGGVLPLPGLPDDRLLAKGSRILTVATDELADSGAYISFLAPTPGGQLIRVIALDFGRPDLDHLCAGVLLCPPGDVLGLSVLDLRVLGLLVEGVTDVPTLAMSLNVAEQAVAEALERSMAALRTNDLTAASVRALRGGMRVPARLAY
jgi:hypothetical protein